MGEGSGDDERTLVADRSLDVRPLIFHIRRGDIRMDDGEASVEVQDRSVRKKS